MTERSDKELFTKLKLCKKYDGLVNDSNDCYVRGLIWEVVLGLEKIGQTKVSLLYFWTIIDSLDFLLPDLYDQEINLSYFRHKQVLVEYQTTRIPDNIHLVFS